MKTVITILALAISTGCMSRHAADAEPADVLRFRGIVTAIEPSPVSESLRNWIVTMHVDQIESGQFSGTNFTFRVHSPTRSGLMSNGTYTVEATPTHDGYVVDEMQWRD